MPKLVRLPQISGLVEVVAWLAAIAFLLGFLGKVWWGFDLCSHFRVQYAAALFLCAAMFAIWRRARLSLACLGAALVIGLTLTPFFLRPSEESANLARLKIISFNIHTENPNHREVLDYLEKENADVILLLEVNDEWLRDLRALEKTYPFHIKAPRSDNFGIAAYSKQPRTRGEITTFGEYGIPVVNLTLQIEDRPLRLIGVHTLPPTDAESNDSRNKELLSLAASLAGADPAVLIGDFNLTPFSPWFGEILYRGGLRDSARGFGCAPTWMRALPCFAIPIDQALVSPSLVVADRKIGARCGSDHNALELTIGLRR